MRFCTECQRAMVRHTDTGAVVFHCTTCGATQEGGAEDARIFSQVLGVRETTEMYENVVRVAAHDRVCQLVERECAQCGLDYMAQLRIGAAETIVYTCKCGYRE